MARRRNGASSRGQRRLLGIERLEGRRILSASAWAAPVPAIHAPPAAFFASPLTQSVAAVKSVNVVETIHHGPAVLVTADTVAAGMSGGLGEGGPLAPDGRDVSAKFAPLKELGSLVRAELTGTTRPVTVVIDSAQLQSFDGAAGLLRSAASTAASSVPPADQRNGSMPLILVLADNHAADNSSVRLLVWMSQMVPPGFAQGLAQGYGQWDLRGRFAELMRDSIFSGHLALPSDGAHSPGERSTDDATQEADRHATNPALFGQSAMNDPMLAGAGRTAAERQVPFDVETTGDAAGAAGREAVGHLVAVGDAAAVWAATFWAAGSRALGQADGGMLDSALHDVLAPRFAFDAATLGDAIRDLVSEANELGSSLLGFLTDSAQPGEMALVAGVAAALAYRRLSGRERREQAELRAILAARFVTGPASLRLGRRKPA